MRIPGFADRPADFIDSLVAAPGAAPAAADSLRSRLTWRERPRRKSRSPKDDHDTVTLHDRPDSDEESDETGLYSGPSAPGSGRAGGRRTGLP
jgi:hypothetical protein